MALVPTFFKNLDVEVFVVLFFVYTGVPSSCMHQAMLFNDKESSEIDNKIFFTINPLSSLSFRLINLNLSCQKYM